MMILGWLLLVAAVLAAAAAVLIRRVTARTAGPDLRAPRDHGWSLVLTIDAVILAAAALVLLLS